MASYYKVEVINFVNPHLIWVAAHKSNKEIVLEQVGIYGILPADISLNVEDENCAFGRRDDWLPGAVKHIEDYLNAAVKVHFKPIHVKEGSSQIKNIKNHIYGKFKLLQANGKWVKLSTLLIKTRFAIKDECEFLTVITQKKFPVKLSERTLEQVKESLKQYKVELENKIGKKKTSDSGLTLESVRLHDQLLLKDAEMKLEDIKMYDLNPESDYDTLGRGYINKISKSNNKVNNMEAEFHLQTDKQQKERSAFSTVPKKKLRQAKDIQNQIIVNQDPAELFWATKNLIDNYIKASNVQPEKRDTDLREETKEGVTNKTNKNLPTEEEAMIEEFRKHDLAEFGNDGIVSTEEKSNAPEEHNFVEDPPTYKKPKKSKSPKTPKLQFDANKEVCITYGPPDVELTTLPLKIISQKQFFHAQSVGEMIGDNVEKDTTEDFHEKIHRQEDLKKKNDFNEKLNEVEDGFKEINKWDDFRGEDSDTECYEAKGKVKSNCGVLDVKSKSKLDDIVQSETKKITDGSTKAYENNIISEKNDTKSEKHEVKSENSDAIHKIKTNFYDSDAKIKNNHKKDAKSNSIELDDIVQRKLKIKITDGRTKAYKNDIISEKIDSKSEKLEIKSENFVATHKIDTNSDEKIKNNLEKETVAKKGAEPTNVLKKTIELHVKSDETSSEDRHSVSNSLLQRKLKIFNANRAEMNRSTTSTASDASNEYSSTTSVDKKKSEPTKTLSDSDNESDLEVLEIIHHEYPKTSITKEIEKAVSDHKLQKNHVNPYKNVTADISVFVDKLVTPILMVHSKFNNRFQLSFKIREVSFNSNIQIILKNMNIEQPMTLQTLSWVSILRGHSTILIGPKGSGKTMGYLPAVCNLVADNDCIIPGNGPQCIIVCATAISVSCVERFAKLFLYKRRVLACYTGMNELDLTTSLLNGCDLLITTPCLLVRLLELDFGVDLSRLTTFVLDDCERLGEVYGSEIKYFFLKIKEMLKNRTVKELKVQYVVASRIWCDFMESLAKKAPDSVVCIGAFQECVLYSKAATTATFVSKEKVKSVLQFLSEVKTQDRTVIVCRSDDEVELLEKALTNAKYSVFACNSTMTVQDLYDLSLSWNDCQTAMSGSVMVCLDDNLNHMNITDAHNLVHYSLPILFSMFCKRFSVLNDNYPSIFKEKNEQVRIKILLEEENTEQLPKILHFIKRCTNEVPEVLEDICASVLSKRELSKAERLVPVCNSLLTLGECPDFWNCHERHALSKDYDSPKEWMPRNGIITFKIIHYHSAVLYSARLLTHMTKNETKKFPQTYSTLSMKLSMYFGMDSNRKLHGVPEVGDICAVCIRQSFFLRGQVVKILDFYRYGRPNHVLVKLIDEERLERCKDVDLYYLPDNMRSTETHVVQIRLGNIKPKDKDVTFSELAMDQLKMITETDPDIYLRAQISFTVGNCIFVEKLETCKDLKFPDRMIVKHDFRRELLSVHAIENKEHLPKLETLCKESNLEIVKEELIVDVPKPLKKIVNPQWAHLEKDDLSLVFFASALDPGTFFVRLVKFEGPCNLLNKDIEKYIATNRDSVTDVSKGVIVLAKTLGSSYERARVDEVMNDRVKCFFVDQGDWMEVSIQDLAHIPEKLITQLPFQAIECRLYGVKPTGDEWTDFSITWFDNQFEDEKGDLKQIYVQYLSKEKATHTEGHKYAVVAIDTTVEQEVNINKTIVDVNMAAIKDTEWDNIDDWISNNKDIKSQTETEENASDDDDKSWENVRHSSSPDRISDISGPKIPLEDLFPKKPLRSVPIQKYSDSESSDSFEINGIEKFTKLFQLTGQLPPQPKSNINLPKLKDKELEKADQKSNDNKIPRTGDKISSTDSNAKINNNKTNDASSMTTKSEDKSKDFSKVNSKISKFSKVKNNDENSKQLMNISSTSDDQSSEVSIVKPKNIDSDNFEVIQKELDSDDLTSPENSGILKSPVSKKNHPEMVERTIKSAKKNPEFELRKPKLIWKQNPNVVNIKILLIGVETYDIQIKERSLKFETYTNDIKYGFDLELYGLIDPKKSTYENKGQYILVQVPKVLKRNWLTLIRSGVQKWITYDMDSIDTSSEEEDAPEMITKDMLKNFREVSSESDDEDFVDDVTFTYQR